MASDSSDTFWDGDTLLLIRLKLVVLVEIFLVAVLGRSVRVVDQAVSLRELDMLGHNHWRKNWNVDSFVVERVDADFVLFGLERKLTAGNGPELVVRLQVGPAEYAAVDDVWKTFAMRDLQSAVY
ncbi:hypothetical protein BpHYR1_008687 [Brachionus plicatilis]|uniref:Uncharacterized protein n=1 Tax=Brachionus plicatilis TaxID=10195 RepID=A0A3M7RHM8_BRAPC|nr:hypothetical protein BpHYR1_008687 [Brachionus plicatilis]